MQIRPTFFSVAGFLAPGTVFIGVAGVLMGVAHSVKLEVAVAKDAELIPGSAGAAVVGTLAVAFILASAFAIGAVLSDAFTFICRQLVLRPLFRPALRSTAQRLLAHRSMQTLVSADMDAREAFVYLSTGGIDLNWYAARIRMMGGTGLGLLACGVLAMILGFGCGTVASLLIVGIVAMLVAGYRSNKFDEYVAATAAVLLHEPKVTKVAEDAG